MARSSAASSSAGAGAAGSSEVTRRLRWAGGSPAAALPPRAKVEAPALAGRPSRSAATNASGSGASASGEQSSRCAGTRSPPAGRHSRSIPEGVAAWTRTVAPRAAAGASRAVAASGSAVSSVAARPSNDRAAAGGAPAGCRSARAVNQKVLPRPGSLTTPISPPSSPTSALQMARPRPVPPKRSEMPSSAWVKRSKIRPAASGAMPMPVSDTSKRSRRPPGSGPSAASTATTTSPASVNFTALPTRFSSTSRRCPASPTRRPGARGVAWTSSRSPFSRACACSRRRTSSSRACRSSGSARRMPAPASMRAKSRMPLIIDSSDLAAPSTVRAISACSRSSVVSRSRPPMPMMAFSGVRSSWLTLARNWVLASLAASACRRAAESLRIRLAA